VDRATLNLFSGPGRPGSGSSHGGGNNHAPHHGSNPFHYPYNPRPYWSCGYSPFPTFGGHYGYGYGYYPWYLYRARFSLFRFAWYAQRWSFGFGYSYSPSYGYGGHFGTYDYPFYRRYAYYPYSYYNTCAYYPAYATVYHSYPSVVRYADVGDPYVEYVDDVPTAVEEVVAPEFSVPEAFLTPLTTGFPEGIPSRELAARGVAWMREGRPLFAAEAFRRSWIAFPGDDYPPMKLSQALLAVGGRYGLAGFALQESLDRSSEWITRPFDIREDFPDPEAFSASVTELKRHILRNGDDGEARFLLGFLLLHGGDPFSAHQEFTTLNAAGWGSPHLDALLAESENRLLGRSR
jgi:hypothetical protein